MEFKYKQIKTPVQAVELYKYLHPIHDVILPPMPLFLEQCAKGLAIICTLNGKIIAGCLSYPMTGNWIEIDQLHVDEEFRDGFIFRKFYYKIYNFHKHTGRRMRAKITNEGMLKKLGHLIEPLPERGEDWYEVFHRGARSK